MGPTIGAKLSIGSYQSIRALSALVKPIWGPMIDEMYAHGEVPRIVNLLEPQAPGTRVSCLECACEIAYYETKEVEEGILGQGIIERLVDL